MTISVIAQITFMVPSLNASVTYTKVTVVQLCIYCTMGGWLGKEQGIWDSVESPMLICAITLRRFFKSPKIEGGLLPPGSAFEFKNLRKFLRRIMVRSNVCRNYCLPWPMGIGEWKVFLLIPVTRN